MNRRDTIVALLALGAAPLAAKAQPPTAPRRIGWLISSRKQYGPMIEAFTAKMKELGSIEGRDFVFEMRESEGRVDKLPALARELVALNPAVIVTAASAPIAALKRETTTVPIVFGTAAEVVEQGFVASFARPGGNITGVTLRGELRGKLVELIRETLPSARRIAVLEHESDAISRRASADYQRVNAMLGNQSRIVRLKGIEDLERAFEEIARARSEALIVGTMALFELHRKRIVELALKARLPVFSTMRSGEEGSLLSYSSDQTENFRRVAVLVDKVLKGAKPADLPVEQPDRFVLEINLRVAKALGIKIPRSVLIRADKVIE
ncbi:MAG: ABC transporter substrate-binding protein [Betaproteobacteria bacterium]|nr:ABC transporter substrate-binding protein [Betaproteobacteria bacterium]